MEEIAENIENLERELNDATKVLEGTTEEIKEVKEEVKEAKEEVVTKEVTDAEKEAHEDEEDLSHGEKSRIGRKVKRLESRLDSTLSEIKSTLDFIKERSATPPQPVVEEEEPDLPDNPTAEEIREYTAKRESLLIKRMEQRESEKSQRQKEATEKYVKEYARLLKETVDPEDDADLYNMLTDEKDLTYNKVYKNDPKEDFLINFRLANKALRTKANPTATKTTVAGKPSQIPTGVNIPGGAKPAAKLVDTSKWSAEEQQLAANFSQDELAAMGIL